MERERLADMLSTDKKRKHVRVLAGVAPDAIAAAVGLMRSWDERKQAEFVENFFDLIDEIRKKQPYRLEEVPTRQVPPALHIGKPIHYVEVLVDHKALPSLNPLTIGTVVSKGTSVESFFAGQVLKMSDSLEEHTFVLLTEVYAPQDFDKRAIIGKGVYLYNARNLQALIRDTDLFRLDSREVVLTAHLVEVELGNVLGCCRWYPDFLDPGFDDDVVISKFVSEDNEGFEMSPLQVPKLKSEQHYLTKLLVMYRDIALRAYPVNTPPLLVSSMFPLLVLVGFGCVVAV